MTETETAELRAEIAKVQGGVGRRRYGKELQRRALAYMSEREAAGATGWVASRELGLGRQTLQRWRKGPGKRARAASGGFRRVAVDVEGVKKGNLGRIVVHGPLGLRIEGLTQPALVAILRALG